MIKKYNHICLILALSLSASAVDAAPKGAYAGISLGASSLEYTTDTLDDFSVKMTLGYQINNYFAVEAAANSLGDVVKGNDDVNITGLEGSVLGFIPLGQKFSVFARLGYWRWDLNLPVGNVIYTADGDTEKFAGLGLQYNPSPKYQLRLEANQYEIGVREARTVNASVALHF